MYARQIINNVSRIVNGVGVSFLVAMMLLTTADVIGRYFFNRPIAGAYELTEFIMVIVVFLGLAHTEAKKDTAAIEIIAERFPSKVRAFTDSATIILSIFFFVVVGWQSIVQANLLKVKFRSSPSTS